MIINGTPNNDTSSGEILAGSLYGGDGGDVLYGGRGNDYLEPGDGTSAQDTNILFKAGTGWERIGIIQDTTNFNFSRDAVFV